MTIGKLHVSAHAWLRLAQRNISVSDLVTTIKIGRKIHRAHATFFFCRLKDTENRRELEHLVGVTVVVENNEIVTAYRARNAIAKIKRLRKRYHSSGKPPINLFQRTAMTASGA